MDKIIKIIIGLFVIVAIASLAVVLVQSTSEKTAAPSAMVDDSTIYFFYGEECPHCKNVEPFIDNLTKKYPDADIRRLEIWHNQTNEQIYTTVNARAGISSPSGVPEIVIGKIVLVGEVEIPAKLEAYVQAIEKKKQSVNP